MGYSPNWLYRVVNEQSGILLPALRKLAEVLEMPAGQFLDPPPAAERVAGSNNDGEEVDVFRKRKSENEPPKKRQIGPEEAVENYRLILDEPMLALKVRGGTLSIEDMAGIADYIRFVRSGREDRGQD